MAVPPNGRAGARVGDLERAALRRAFEEFRRILRPGGRISLWEPINSFAFPEPPHLLFGYDVSPVLELAGRVRAIYEQREASVASPMLGFNERDLLAIAEDAGFEDLLLELRAEVRSHESVRDWDALLATAPNPLAPTWSEAIEAALEATEAEQFLAHLRPLVEAGQGTWLMAKSHLSARAPGSRSSNATKWSPPQLRSSNEPELRLVGGEALE